MESVKLTRRERAVLRSMWEIGNASLIASRTTTGAAAYRLYDGKMNPMQVVRDGVVSRLCNKGALIIEHGKKILSPAVVFSGKHIKFTSPMENELFKTGVRQSFCDGSDMPTCWQAWFTVGVQTFHISPTHDTKEEALVMQTCVVNALTNLVKSARLTIQVPEVRS